MILKAFRARTVAEGNHVATVRSFSAKQEQGTFIKKDFDYTEHQ